MLRYWNGSAWENWREAAVAAPVTPAAANGLAVTALVFSLVGIALDLTVVGLLIGWIFSITGMVVAEFAVRKARTAGRRGMSLWARWLGRVPFLIVVVVILVRLIFAISHS